MSREKPTIHEGVALLECDSRATLEEMIRHLAGLDLHPRRVGARGLVFPSTEVAVVVRALRSRECFPRVLGPTTDESSQEEN